MPNIDAYIPAGALSPDAERALIATVTDIVLRHEGADPANPLVRSIAWLALHRPEMYVAGEPATDAPRYRFYTAAPEGQFDDERRRAMVAEITEAVLDAEAGAYPRDPQRVWVFTPDIPEGTWGAGGQVVRLADILSFAVGDADLGRKLAEKALARSRNANV
ncbi:tautomerase family protein [Nocardia sp. bgisy118]|uniref:tautomerase family protein n=1 Tax=Nocardia sp. bgisy118 TaxID=3413786 RepID=UPI003F49F89A